MADISLERYLTDEWDGNDAPTFQVSGPCKITAHSEKGFTKMPFIGEEELRPFECYLGKKKQLIIKLRRLGAEGMPKSTWLEMPLGEAEQNLDGFKGHFQRLMTEYSDEFTNRSREVGAAKESTADTEARRRHADPLFGSW